MDERVKVKVRVYENTHCTDPTVWSDPVSCLLSEREVASWTPAKSTHCVFVMDVQGKNGQEKKHQTVALVKFLHYNLTVRQRTLVRHFILKSNLLSAFPHLFAPRRT